MPLLLFSVESFSHQDNTDVATAKTEFDQLYRDALGGDDAVHYDKHLKFAENSHLSQGTLPLPLLSLFLRRMTGNYFTFSS